MLISVIIIGMMEAVMKFFTRMCKRICHLFYDRRVDQQIAAFDHQKDVAAINKYKQHTVSGK